MVALKALLLSSAVTLLSASPALAAAAKKGKEESSLMKYAVPVLAGVVGFVVVFKISKKVVHRMRKGEKGPNMSVKNSDQRLRRKMEEEQMAQESEAPSAIGATPPSPQAATPQAATAPGWHPDPSGQAQLRYWDGNQWTDKTHNEQMQEGWYPDPQDQGQMRWWDGSQWSSNVRPNG